MIKIPTQTLTSPTIQLELLNIAHKDELYTAAQHENIWTYNGSKGFGEHFHSWFDTALKGLEQNKQIPYVVRRLSDNKIIGSTRIYDFYPEHKRLAIGYTWYVPEVWGSYVNPACKMMLLKHAFDNLKFNRIEFVTDSRNSRSRAAIKKLGAIEEGILRQHMVLESGLIRDTVVFSIVREDWPKVEAVLQKRLGSL